MLKQAGLSVRDFLYLLPFSKSLLKHGEWTDMGSTVCSTIQLRPESQINNEGSCGGKGS